MKRLFFLLCTSQKIVIMKKIVNYLIILLLFSACTKKDIQVQSDPELSSKLNVHKNTGNNSTLVTTFSATGITSVSAIVGGSVSTNGNGNGIAKGVCYNTSPGPTTVNSTVSGGSGSGIFACSLSGLIPNTVYYARAYAIKNSETYYGNEVSFTTSPASGTVTDIDGNVYNIISIGTQTWMLENLRTTHYRDGSPIPNVTDNTEWAGLFSGAYCDYNNAPSNSVVYGKLYNLYTADDPRNIAPEGWHVPTISEWNVLINFLGGSTIAGGKLKEAGLAHWLSPNTGADNSSGFTALPGGIRTINGTFAGLGTMGHFLKRTGNFFPIYYPILNYNSAVVSSGGVISMRIAGSVRCIKD